jgi:anti-sigma factor RsiW
VLERTVTHLLDGELPPEGRAALRAYLEVPDDPKAKASPFAFDRRFVDGKLRGLLHLVLSTPEYQLS